MTVCCAFGCKNRSGNKKKVTEDADPEKINEASAIIKITFFK